MDEHPIISIVDDDLSVRKALGRLLRSAGYDVSLFESSEAFLNANAVEKTDCLVLDVALPGKSGLQLQKELIASTKKCPIVFISAYDDEASREVALGEGAIDFLGKPLDVEHLLKVIEQAVSTN